MILLEVMRPCEPNEHLQIKSILKLTVYDPVNLRGRPESKRVAVTITPQVPKPEALPKLIPAWKVTFKFFQNHFVALKVVGAPWGPTPYGRQVPNLETLKGLKLGSFLREGIWRQ